MRKEPAWTGPAYGRTPLIAVAVLLTACAAPAGQLPPAPGPAGPTDTPRRAAPPAVQVDLGPDGELRIHLAAAPPDAAAEAPPEEPPPREPAKERWAWFSGTDRAFARLLADQREVQIRAGMATARHGDTFGDVVIGGDLAIFSRTRRDDWADSLTLRGLFTARFHMNSESTNLLNTDYVGGLAYGSRFGGDSWDLFLYHQSSHLGDEPLDFGDRARIDYGREAVRFLWSHHFTDAFRVYGGPTFNFSGMPFLRYKTTAQAGAEYAFAPWGRPMYVAADVQARETNDWRPGLNIQVGMELGDPDSPDRHPRIFVEFFTGYSNMGQYWNVYETSFMVGFGYDW